MNRYLRAYGDHRGDPADDTEAIRRMILRRPSATEISRVAGREGMMRPREDGLPKRRPGRNDEGRGVENAIGYDAGLAVGKPRRAKECYISESSFVDNHRRVYS